MPTPAQLYGFAAPSNYGPGTGRKTPAAIAALVPPPEPASVTAARIASYQSQYGRFANLGPLPPKPPAPPPPPGGETAPWFRNLSGTTTPMANGYGYFEPYYGPAPGTASYNAFTDELQGLIGQFGPAACDRLDGWQRDLCGFLVGAAGGGGGAEGAEQTAANNSVGVSSCPDGYEERDGQCVTVGGRGMVERTLPGGRTGTLADEAGTAVIGAFGVPAILPFQRGTIQRNDGSVGAILGCPYGTVLGRDDLCYQKSTIPRQFRKHRPAPRPLLSAQDGKILRRAKSLEKKLRRVSNRFAPRKASRRSSSKGVITKAEAARALRS